MTILAQSHEKHYLYGNARKKNIILIYIYIHTRRIMFSILFMNNFFNGKKQIKIKEDKNKKTKIRETIYIMTFF